MNPADPHGSWAAGSTLAAVIAVPLAIGLVVCGFYRLVIFLAPLEPTGDSNMADMTTDARGLDGRERGDAGATGSFRVIEDDGEIDVPASPGDDGISRLAVAEASQSVPARSGNARTLALAILGEAAMLCRDAGVIAPDIYATVEKTLFGARDQMPDLGRAEGRIDRIDDALADLAELLGLDDDGPDDLIYDADDLDDDIDTEG